MEKILSAKLSPIEGKSTHLVYRDGVLLERVKAIGQEPVETIIKDPAILANETQAIANYKEMPGWATWTAQEANDHIVSNTFSGKTKDTVYAEIDGINNIAQTKVALKQIVGVIYAFGAILQAMAKAIVYFRNLLIR